MAPGSQVFRRNRFWLPLTISSCFRRITRLCKGSECITCKSYVVPRAANLFANFRNSGECYLRPRRLVRTCHIESLDVSCFLLLLGSYSTALSSTQCMREHLLVCLTVFVALGSLCARRKPPRHRSSISFGASSRSCRYALRRDFDLWSSDNQFFCRGELQLSRGMFR